ncbi:MAG: RNA-directed DNA polymerase [Dehalococcoidia bacterium]
MPSTQTPFLSANNFKLAFTRLQRSMMDLDYKAFYRHLMPAYEVALDDNIEYLIGEISSGGYAPSPPTIIHQPKRTLILRPRAIISFKDLLVYQALANVIAARVHPEQHRRAHTRRFGAISAGTHSPYFLRPWQEGYDAFVFSAEHAIASGRKIAGEFDLTSFYDLIDHRVLRSRLESMGCDELALTILFESCLPAWTNPDPLLQRGHGLPQGPEASALLAEAMLFHFDEIDFGDATYLRYIDDVLLLGTNQQVVRRGLLALDLAAKSVGLVPQGAKMAVRSVASVDDIIKRLPSTFESDPDPRTPPRQHSQRELGQLLTSSLTRENKALAVINDTYFKFAIGRLNPTKRTLRRIAPLFLSRPDLAPVLSRYASRFPGDHEATDILVAAILGDPPYAASTAAFIDAAALTEPKGTHAGLRTAVDTAAFRSMEPADLRFCTSLLAFRGNRVGPIAALELIRTEPSAIGRGYAFEQLFGDHPAATHKIDHAREFLEDTLSDPDEDLARYAAAVLAANWPTFLTDQYRLKRTARDSVRLLLYGKGLRKRRPRHLGVIDRWVRSLRIDLTFSWRKVLGTDFAELEAACARFQIEKSRPDDASSKLIKFDTFLDGILQSHAKSTPALEASFRQLAGNRRSHPDYGLWLQNTSLKSSITARTHAWLVDVHRARTASAHFRQSSGTRRGEINKPVTLGEFNNLMSHAQGAVFDLMKRWPSSRNFSAVQPVRNRGIGSASTAAQRRARSP